MLITLAACNPARDVYEVEADDGVFIINTENGTIIAGGEV